jgi:HPt (histidine-containing phosphotransfer) domain-containing protein
MNEADAFDFTLPVFNSGQLEALRALTEDDDSGVLDGIVQQFKDDAVLLFKNLDDAILKGDFPRITDLAHTIKGSGATFGMIRLGALALRMEIAAKKTDASEVARLNAPVRQAYVAALPELEKALGGG